MIIQWYYDFQTSKMVVYTLQYNLFQKLLVECDCHIYPRMSNYYQHMQPQLSDNEDENKKKARQKTINFLAYLSLFVLYCLIIAYAVFSQSIFSAVAIAFLILELVLVIISPAHLSLRNQTDQAYEWTKVLAYPFNKILRLLFVIVNIAFFIIKVVIYETGTADNWDQTLQDLLEVQSRLQVFLPLLLLPFATFALFLNEKPKLLKDYSKKLSPNIALPLYLMLGTLMILNQIFTVSVVGLIYFILALYLFWLKSFNFKDIEAKILLYIIQVVTFVVILFNFMATIDYFQTEESQKMFAMFGLNSISQFTLTSFNQGHIICQGLLAFLAAYISRLIFYHKFNSLCKKDQSQEFDQIMKIDRKQSDKTQRDVGQIEVHKSYRRAQSDLQALQLGKVMRPEKQVEMKNMSERYSIPNVQTLRQQLQEQKMLIQVVKLQEEPVDELKLKKDSSKNQGSLLFQKIRQSLFKAIQAVYNFLNSPQFSLRVIEVLSIIVIQRFNNVYSFVALIWLAIVSTVQNHRFVMMITGIILLPMQLCNFMIAYFYNIPSSPAKNVTDASIFGFEQHTQMWLDVLIFNAYFNYVFLYLKSYHKPQKNNQRKSFQRTPRVWELLLAFLFRYSYMLTMIAMFFLGFSNPTLMNILLVGLFLIFFSKGDTLIVVKKSKQGKQKMTLTTFSKRYWFIIVGYTLLCILAKYIYFLFFNGDLQSELQPTGINQVYNWSFNFSLSSVCLSNTTPWFIIFILAEIQIIIYRSYIYTNISFSIMSYVNKDTKIRPNTKKEQQKRAFINFFIGLSQFYYQSLYYVSGIIILACSYRWCFLSLAIVVLTIFGLLISFTKKLIGTILLLNLTFLFGNYFILLINNYPTIINFLTKDLVDTINYISQLIGFSRQSSSYASIFILNVVNFYFLTLCYYLANILSTPVESQQGFPQQSREPSMLRENLIPDDLHRSNFERSVIDSQFDENFAENYKRGVITDIQKYYNENLIKKYEWVRKVGAFFVQFWTDIVTIFVIIQCLFFRVSVSMLLFLIVYMVFYYILFDRLGNLFRSSNYYDQIKNQLNTYRSKQQLLEQESDFTNMISDRQMLMRTEMQMRITEQRSRQLKNEFKKKIWKFSAFLSATCLILTYASQFIISDYYVDHVNFPYTEQLEVILYIIGINVNPGQGIGMYIYFYYVMLLINVIEKLVLVFIQQISLLEGEEGSSSVAKTIRQLPKLEDPAYLINSHVSEHFIEEVEVIEEMKAGQELNFIQTVVEQLVPQDYFQQANLLIYFQYRYSQMKINMMFGFLSFIIRFYLWLMLLNVYAKTDIFSFAYLISVLYFWFKPLEFDLIRNINKAAIIILCLQYIVLILDINTVVSPLPLPYGKNLSLLQYLINNNSLVSFIAVSSRDTSSNSDFVISFIVNAIIIFLTELCFTIFTLLTESMMKNIFMVYLKYQNILQKLQNIRVLDPIIINYNNYKHLSYRGLNFLYERIILSSYLLVALLMFILLAGVQGYLAIVLLCISFLYIYFGIVSRVSQTQQIITYTRYYFRVFNILQFICLLVTSILEIPFIQENTEINSLVDEVGALSSLEQIFLMLFIQLWLDLHASNEFASMYNDYHKQTRIRQTVFLRSLAFQRNNFLLESLINQYKEVLSFDLSISLAIKVIKEWHSSTDKKLKLVEYDFETNRLGKYNQQIQKEIEEDRYTDDHKEFSAILAKYVKEYTDLPLFYNYIEMTRYIVGRVETIILNGDIDLSCWSFIKEDYSYVQEIIEAYDVRLKELLEEIVEADQDQSMEATLLSLRQNLFVGDKDASPVKIKLLTPPKLQIDIEPKPQHSLTPNYLLPFLISNIETLLLLLTVCYYIANPCTLSFPIIAFLFCYYTIASRKHVYILVVYIFLLILVAEILTQVDPNNTILGSGNIKFFFDTNPVTYEVYYNQPYLYFLFVMIFLSQEVIRYKGNRYKSQLEVENLQQAFLRVLMNEPLESKLNIWKYKNQEQGTAQKFNPFTVATQEIDNKFEKLVENESIFDDVFSDRKIGVDLYPAICAVQILLMIYMIFFYPLMTYVQGFSIEDSTKYFQFSSDMVIGVLVHVIVMIIERYIAIIVMSRRTKLIIKYVFTMVILLMFSWFIYYKAPIQTFISSEATIYSPSSALIAFSFFYFLYFYLSALQIKYGYKEFKSLNSLMTRRGYVNYYAVSVYTAIPFLYELKIIIDWTFTSTSLSLFDWFRQFSIYLRAFKAKIQYYNATSNTLGEEQAWYSKIMGWAGFIIIILIIFGPMILFSGLNPIAEPNLVTSGSLSVALQIINGNSFTLYSTSHFSTPPQDFTEQQFISQGFINVPTLQQMKPSDIPQQFQGITYDPFSDNNWGIAQPNYKKLLNLLNTTINQLQTTNTSNLSFQFVTTYQLNRQVAATVSNSAQFTYPNNGSTLSLDILKQTYDTLFLCNASIYLPQFYNQLIRLNTVGNSYKPRPIPYTNGTNNQPYITDVTLNLFCNTPGPLVIDTNQVFWGLYLNNQNSSGLQLYVYCDKYQNIIGGYGFTALYTSIILVVAGFVRSMFDGNMPLIPYEMNPRPDNILQICEAINTLRVRKQYRQEYLMYYELIDLIRSPEIMKYMSGSYPYLIEKAHEQTSKQMRLKEIEKDKNA